MGSLSQKLSFQGFRALLFASSTGNHPFSGVYVSVNSTIPSLTKNGPKARVMSTYTVAGLSLVEGYPFVVALKEHRKKHRFRGSPFRGSTAFGCFWGCFEGQPKGTPTVFGVPYLNTQYEQGTM